MEIIWTEFALTTFEEEIDFILLKWNINEVQKFIILVNKNIDLLEKNINQDKPIANKENVFLKVVSKQTSLIYRIEINSNKICLLRFWNNKRNPKNLKRFLKRLE